MNQIVQISQAQVEMAFVATCIEATARTMGISYSEVYNRMKRLNLIDKYIYPCYGVLHTESRENIVKDLMNCMDTWERKLSVKQ